MARSYGSAGGCGPAEKDTREKRIARIPRTIARLKVISTFSGESNMPRLPTRIELWALVLQLQEKIEALKAKVRRLEGKG